MFMADTLQHEDTPYVLHPLLKMMKPSIIVELGTHTGGFANFLSDYAERIYTFDCKNENHIPLKPNVRFLQMSVRESDTQMLVKGLLQTPRALLICDNGDKPWEAKTYSEFLEPNGILMVHDYGPVETWSCTEFRDEDVPASVMNISTPESRRIAWFIGIRK